MIPEDAAINAAIATDPDTLEITRDMVANLRPARKPGQRGKQKAPTRELVRVRLDPRVVAHFKAAGEKGWTTRINDFLVDKVVRE